MDNLHYEAQKMTKEIYDIDKELEKNLSDRKRNAIERKQLLKNRNMRKGNLNRIIKLMKNGGIIG